MLVFEESGKLEYLETNLLEQRREPTTNSTQIWCRHQDSNPRRIGGRWVLSPVHHPCFSLITEALLRQGRVGMSLVWISKAVVSCIEEKAMLLSLLVFYYCIYSFTHCCGSFNLFSSCLLPFQLSDVAISSPYFTLTRLHCSCTNDQLYLGPCQGYTCNIKIKINAFSYWFSLTYVQSWLECFHKEPFLSPAHTQTHPSYTSGMALNHWRKEN